MKFAIMAGGTGGHIFPGIAVAKALQKRGHQIYWLGAKGGMEERIVKQHGIPLTLLNIKPLRGKGILGLLGMPFRMLSGVMQARRFFKTEQIDAAISMGGYVAAPGGFAARILPTKLIVHEQNSVFGMTNKALAKRADLVLTGFDLSGKYQSHWVGNPVRDSIEEIDIDRQRKQPVNVLVLGGSLGAQSLNELVPELLSQELETGTIKVKHQCGRNKLNATKQAYGTHHNEVDIQPFIQDMAAAYRWADICICRAGALTVAEITAAGVPTIMVPYPHAVDDHQTHNALSLVKENAGMIWQESESTEVLRGLFQELMNASRRTEIRTRLTGLKKSNVSMKIAEMCEQVLV